MQSIANKADPSLTLCAAAIISQNTCIDPTISCDPLLSSLLLTLNTQIGWQFFSSKVIILPSIADYMKPTAAFLWQKIATRAKDSNDQFEGLETAGNSCFKIVNINFEAIIYTNEEIKENSRTKFDVLEPFIRCPLDEKKAAGICVSAKLRIDLSPVLICGQRDGKGREGTGGGGGGGAM